jgi:TolB-like protein
MTSESSGSEGLKTFDVYVREERGERVGTAIKRGFCWPGLFFTFVWAFANRLWVLGVVLITSVTFFNTLWVYFSEDDPTLGWPNLIIAAIAVFVGFKGNDLHRARREAQGFRKETTVQGRGPSEVLSRLGIPKARALAYSFGGVVAASIFIGIALFFVMVGGASFIDGDRAFAMSIALAGVCWFGIPGLILWARSMRPPLSLLKGLAWGFGACLIAMPLGTYVRLAPERSEPAPRGSEPAPRGRVPDARTINTAIGFVAVLPLENLSGDPEYERFAAVMTKALTSEIDDSLGIFIEPYEHIITYKYDSISELAFDAVLDGSVLRSNSRARIEVEFILLFPATIQLFADRFDGDLEEIPGWQSDVVRAVAAQVRNLTEADVDALRITGLQEDVQSLIDLGVLDEQNGTALVATISNALKSVRNDRPNTVMLLDAFINQVQGFIDGGILTPVHGQPLIDEARGII